MKKVPYTGRSKDEQIRCEKCGTLVTIGESVWMNSYTEELTVWCENCKIQIGGIISKRP